MTNEKLLTFVIAVVATTSVIAFVRNGEGAPSDAQSGAPVANAMAPDVSLGASLKPFCRSGGKTTGASSPVAEGATQSDRDLMDGVKREDGNEQCQLGGFVELHVGAEVRGSGPLAAKLLIVPHVPLHCSALDPDDVAVFVRKGSITIESPAIVSPLDIVIHSMRELACGMRLDIRDCHPNDPDVLVLRVGQENWLDVSLDIAWDMKRFTEISMFRPGSHELRAKVSPQPDVVSWQPRWENVAGELVSEPIAIRVFDTGAVPLGRRVSELLDQWHTFTWNTQLRIMEIGLRDDWLSDDLAERIYFRTPFTYRESLRARVEQLRRQTAP